MASGKMSQRLSVKTCPIGCKRQHVVEVADETAPILLFGLAASSPKNVFFETLQIKRDHRVTVICPVSGKRFILVFRPPDAWKAVRVVRVETLEV